MRAVLLARATVTSIFGLRASIRASHEPAGVPRCPAQRTTALAPRMSKRRMVRSPIFEIAPSFCLPPVDFCRGVSPSQAAKSRPAWKPSGAGTRAVIAVAAIGTDARDRYQPARHGVGLRALGDLGIQRLDLRLQGL